MQYVSTLTFADILRLPITPDAKISITVFQNELNKQEMLDNLKKLRGSGNGTLLDKLLQERKSDKNRTN